tara:strand:- start:65 stop:481 length:417 start_codon:yes stop_codon:yes gene_type:complete
MIFSPKDVKAIKKECKECGKMKLHDQFATASWKTLADGTRKHYRRRYCHKCYYKRVNKKKYLELKKWYNNYKQKQQCKDCGYDRYPRALEFHHTKNNKLHNVSDMIADLFSKTTIMKEIKKCIVLCVRCHAEKHYIAN